MAKYCHEISRTTITGIPPAPRGQQSFTAIFKIDPDGVLNIEAFSNAVGGQSRKKLEIKHEGLKMNKVVLQDAIMRALKEAIF